MSVLRSIVDQALRLSSLRQPALAVFDLDSTVFDLSPRTLEIVRSFIGQSEHRQLFPQECQILAGFANHAKDWGLAEPLERAGFTADQSVVKALRSYWSGKFFASEFLSHDEPHKGAASFVRQLQSAGTEILYLSGRDEPNMLEGTLKSLRNHGFPIDAAGVTLALKPHAALDDAQFKVDHLAEIAAQTRFAKIWLFENEPYNINQIAARIPEIEMIFFDSCHSGREQVQVPAARISDFSL